MESHSSWLTSLLNGGHLAQIGSQLERFSLVQHVQHWLPHSFPSYDWALLIALLLTLLLAAAASAAETSLTSVSHIKIRNQAEEGDETAQRIRRILEHPDVFLSTILIVSNVAVITASTLATLIAISLDFTGAEAVSTVLLSIIVLIFCEVTPKTAAVQAPEVWARWLIRPVEALAYILRPAVYTLNAITSGILRMFGVQGKRRGPFVTEDELRLLVEVGEEEGVLEEEEREMIHNVFDLADTAVREIMIPRVDMVTVKINDTVDAVTQLIVQGGQSRIPVYDAAGADIVGVLYAKDLLRVLASQAKMAPRPQLVRDLPLREPYFVPESKRLDDLLHEMQRQHVHIAMVVDEYGAVAGLVTIEDLVEEIIGDIQDEYDKEEQLFEQVGPNEYIVDAKISLDDLNELLETDLTSEDYDTLGGLVYAQLDKIPSVGDTVTSDGLTLTVLGAKGRRITKVKVVRSTPDDANADTPPTTPNRSVDRSDAAQRVVEEEQALTPTAPTTASALIASEEAAPNSPLQHDQVLAQKAENTRRTEPPLAQTPAGRTAQAPVNGRNAGNTGTNQPAQQQQGVKSGPRQQAASALRPTPPSQPQRGRQPSSLRLTQSVPGAQGAQTSHNGRNQNNQGSHGSSEARRGNERGAERARERQAKSRASS